MKSGRIPMKKATAPIAEPAIAFQNSPTARAAAASRRATLRCFSQGRVIPHRTSVAAGAAKESGRIRRRAAGPWCRRLSSVWDNPATHLLYRPKTMPTIIQAANLIESVAAALQYIS